MRHRNITDEQEERVMRYTIVVLAAAALFALPAASFAGGFCCQLRTGVQETLGGPAPGPGSVSVAVDYTYSRMQGIYEGDTSKSLAEVLDDPRFMKMMGIVPDDMDMRRITLSAGYAPTDDLRLFLSVPYVINDMTMKMFTMGNWRTMDMDRVEGLGDITLFGLYRVYKDRDVMPQKALSAGVGLKFPTGSWTESQRGSRLHAHMQPGTGSWDPMLKVVYVQMISSELLVNADLTYQFTTENPLGYEFGDTLSMDADLFYNLLDFMNVSVGAEYFHSEQADDREGNYKGNVSKRMTDFTGYTGEDSVWAKAGVQLLPFDGASVDLDFSYPLYYHVGGIQQVTDYKTTLRMSYSF